MEDLLRISVAQGSSQIEISCRSLPRELNNLILHSTSRSCGSLKGLVCVCGAVDVHPQGLSALHFLVAMAAAESMAAPTHVEHHDTTRAAVSTTALGVCMLRAWESKKQESERLFSDPFAAVICGTDVEELPLMKEVGQNKEFWTDFIAVRTRWIDEQVRRSGFLKFGATVCPEHTLLIPAQHDGLPLLSMIGFLRK